ncbi:MAG: SIS domain-containing protein [Candidatus Odinarchaeia archaeon]
MTDNYKAIVSTPESLKLTYTVIKNKLGENEDFLKKDFKKILLTGCGDSYIIGYISKFYFNQVCGLDSNVFYPLDFNYLSEKSLRKNLLIAISASGRTIQTLNVIRNIQDSILTVSLTNTYNSKLGSLVDFELVAECHPPLGLSPSKTTLTGLFALMLLGLRIGYIQENLSKEDYITWENKLLSLPSRLNEEMSKIEKTSLKLAEKLAEINNIYFTGSGPYLGCCMIGEAKIKEYSLCLSEAVELEDFVHYHILSVTDKTVIIPLKPFKKDILRFNEILNGLKKLRLEHFVLESDWDPWLSIFYYTVFLQLLVYNIMKVKGLNPTGFRQPHASTIKLVDESS